MLVLSLARKYKMQNSWEGAFEVIAVNEDTHHVKKPPGNAVPQLVHVHRLTAYHSQETMVNMSYGVEGETEAHHLTDLMSECQTDSSLESIDICTALTKMEKAEVLSVLLENTFFSPTSQGRNTYSCIKLLKRTTDTSQQTLYGHWQRARANVCRNKKHVRAVSN